MILLHLLFSTVLGIQVGLNVSKSSLQRDHKAKIRTKMIFIYAFFLNIILIMFSFLRKKILHFFKFLLDYTPNQGWKIKWLKYFVNKNQGSKLDIQFSEQCFVLFVIFLHCQQSTDKINFRWCYNEWIDGDSLIVLMMKKVAKNKVFFFFSFYYNFVLRWYFLLYYMTWKRI